MEGICTCMESSKNVWMSLGEMDGLQLREPAQSLRQLQKVRDANTLEVMSARRYWNTAGHEERTGTRTLGASKMRQQCERAVGEAISRR